MPDDDELIITCERSDQTVLVRIAGELDLGAAEQVIATIASIIADDGCSHIEADLSALEFIDSSGLDALLAARQHATETHRAFLVSNPQPAVRRLLEITGAAALLGDTAGK